MLLVGNIVVSLVVSLSILLIGIFELIPAMTDANRVVQITFFKIILDYAIFAFMINLLREIVKDAEDFEGDNQQGMQTLAVTVRTLATNDLTKNNFTQNILKEFNIGILNGIIFAVISALIVQLWFQDNLLSLIISMSMIITMMVAGLFGIVVPITLKKMSSSFEHCKITFPAMTK